MLETIAPAGLVLANPLQPPPVTGTMQVQQRKGLAALHPRTASAGTARAQASRGFKEAALALLLLLAVRVAPGRLLAALALPLLLLLGLFGNSILKSVQLLQLPPARTDTQLLQLPPHMCTDKTLLHSRQAFPEAYEEF